jgi:hypothetical protein
MSNFCADACGLIIAILAVVLFIAFSGIILISTVCADACGLVIAILAVVLFIALSGITVRCICGCADACGLDRTLVDVMAASMMVLILSSSLGAAIFLCVKINNTLTVFTMILILSPMFVNNSNTTIYVLKFLFLSLLFDHCIHQPNRREAN